MKEFPWTEERVATLRRLYAEGASYTRIMAAVGCASRSMVCGKIMRLREAGAIASARREPGGVRKQTPLEQRRSPGVAHVPLIRARHGEGKNDREIADEIGIRPDDVRYIRKVEGLKANYVPAIVVIPGYADDLRRMVQSGRTDGEVAEALGITLGQARYERRRQGLKGSVPPPRPRIAMTTIAKGDSSAIVEKVFAEGFMGQRSRVDIVGLEPGMCHFPIDQPDGRTRFCGDEAGPDQVYCSHHASRCYTISKVRRVLKPAHVYTARR